MKRILLLFCYFLPSITSGQQPIRVGAKHFNEGYILSEMISQILEEGGYTVQRSFNLGGTSVSFEALRTGSIDVYPEYTGTISAEILKSNQTSTWQEINMDLRNRFQLEISSPYGFNNTYALVIRKELAAKLEIRNVSDLEENKNLKIGLSYEFIERKDGWRNLATFYNLPQKPIALEHGLAYQAILENKIEITDAYSTDGEINQYNLLLLDDDKRFFRDYQAVSFYSVNLPQKAKRLLDQLSSLISNEDMQGLNASALFENMTHKEIAHAFLVRKGIVTGKSGTKQSKLGRILEKTWEHVTLTFIALVASIIVAVPIGIWLYRLPRFSRIILYGTGILQTIPSIALLALMIPVLGIGKVPAIFALFLYALLPILRNTVIGLATVDPILKNVASAMGLNPRQRLRLVELPLALPMVLTGIRTAAVINVGTATLAAFIGAGGLGEFIVTGLALNNADMILMGAIPAALLAVFIELLFEAIEWWLIPNHLRQKLL